MIPDKVHYIWLGNGRHSSLMDSCILSWRRNLPDCEIIEWNESTLNLEEKRKECRFLDECLKRKMWAFASDYLRVKLLYEEGGIYLDTDMEILKDFRELYGADTDMVVGEELLGTLSCGIMGFAPRHPLLERLLQFYELEVMDDPSGLVTAPEAFNRFLTPKLLADAVVLPPVYFYPFYFNETFSLDCVKQDTYGIHWWSASWADNLQKNIFWATKHLSHRPVYKSCIVAKKTLGHIKRKIRAL